MGTAGKLGTGRGLHVQLSTSDLTESFMLPIALPCRELHPELGTAGGGTGYTWAGQSRHLCPVQPKKGLHLEPASWTPKVTPLSWRSEAAGFDSMTLRARGVLREAEEPILKAFSCRRPPL